MRSPSPEADWLAAVAQAGAASAAGVAAERIDGDVLLRRLLARRASYGITRLGSLTGLDRLGIPVAQAVRPWSLSLSVHQGKGLTARDAAISALMEAVERAAAETIDARRVRTMPVDACADAHLWPELWARRPAQDRDRPLAWIAGWDLLAGRERHVPLALVDTVYTWPSPHPEWLPRNTTGLAAGTGPPQALVSACLEVLERDAVARAKRVPHFFERHRVDASTVRSGKAGSILARIREAGLVAGIWTVPAPHDLPVVWCQVMEDAGTPELAPLPAEGFACAGSFDEACAAALLEACQARLTAIAGSREDMTSAIYDAPRDYAVLAEWRRFIGSPAPGPEPGFVAPGEADLPGVLHGLRQAGARAAVAVPIAIDPQGPLAVMRVVAPPLVSNPHAP
jgi:ribosomal protein S12 methylthiotransferase accessory factor